MGVLSVLRRALVHLRGPVWPVLEALSAPTTGLHECPDCRRDRVAPLSIDEADDDHWDVTLRCGECGIVRELRITNAQADDYGEALDRHAAAIERELFRMDAERMAVQADSFIRALSLDLIEASDFAP